MQLSRVLQICIYLVVGILVTSDFCTFKLLAVVDETLTLAVRSRLGGAGAAAGLRGLRGEDPQRHVRGRAGAAVREGRQDLRVPPHDGVQRREPRLRLRHVHQQVALRDCVGPAR